MIDRKDEAEFRMSLYKEISLTCLKNVDSKKERYNEKAIYLFFKAFNKEKREPDFSKVREYLHSSKFKQDSLLSREKLLDRLTSVFNDKYIHISSFKEKEKYKKIEKEIKKSILSSNMSWIKCFEMYTNLYNKEKQMLDFLKEEEKKKILEQANSNTANVQRNALKEVNLAPRTRINPDIHSTGTLYASSTKLSDQDILETISTIFNRAQNNSGYIYLSNEEIVILKKHLGTLWNQDFKKTLEEGTRMKYIFNSFKKSPPKISDLLELATILSEEVPKELLRYSSAYYGEASMHQTQILNEIDILHAIENYQKAYESYKKHYDSLSTKEKEIEIRKIKNLVSPRFLQSIGEENIKIESISPKKLISLINKKVSSKMVKNYQIYTSDKPLITAERITKATKYMSLEEVSYIYKEINSKEKIVHGITEEQIKESQRKIAEDNKNLQYNFVIAISARIHHKALAVEEERKLLENICQSYLHENLKETPVKKSLQFFAENGVLTTNPSKLTEYNIYGMSKLKQTLLKVSGNYDMLKALKDRKIQTREDQIAIFEELNNILGGNNEKGRRL